MRASVGLGNAISGVYVSGFKLKHRILISPENTILPFEFLGGQSHIRFNLNLAILSRRRKLSFVDPPAGDCLANNLAHKLYDQHNSQRTLLARNSA